MLKKFSKFARHNQGLVERANKVHNKLMLEQRRLVQGARGELSSSSENSYDDNMLCQYIRDADPNLGLKFDKYLKKKIKVWHENNLGSINTETQTKMEKILNKNN